MSTLSTAVVARTKVLSSQWDTATVVTFGGNWYVVS